MREIAALRRPGRRPAVRRDRHLRRRDRARRAPRHASRRRRTRSRSTSRASRSRSRVGIGSATSVRVGHAVGAGDLALARRRGVIGLALGLARDGVFAATFLAIAARARVRVHRRRRGDRRGHGPAAPDRGAVPALRRHAGDRRRRAARASATRARRSSATSIGHYVRRPADLARARRSAPASARPACGGACRPGSPSPRSTCWRASSPRRAPRPRSERRLEARDEGRRAAPRADAVVEREREVEPEQLARGLRDQHRGSRGRRRGGAASAGASRPRRRRRRTARRRRGAPRSRVGIERSSKLPRTIGAAPKNSLIEKPRRPLSEPIVKNRFGGVVPRASRRRAARRGARTSSVGDDGADATPSAVLSIQLAVLAARARRRPRSAHEAVAAPRERPRQRRRCRAGSCASEPSSLEADAERDVEVGPEPDVLGEVVRRTLRSVRNRGVKSA